MEVFVEFKINADKLSVEGIAYDEFLQLDVFCDKLFHGEIINEDY